MDLRALSLSFRILLSSVVLDICTKILVHSDMVKRSECLAYEHQGWRFEWYVNEGGNSPSADYYHKELTEDEKDDLTALFEFLAECNGQLRNKEKIRYEGDGLFAFKPRPHRFLAFFVRGKTVIITHGFKKKRQDLPPNEKKKAKAYRADYTSRIAGDRYYVEGD
jgi:hypothetical protein